MAVKDNTSIYIDSTQIKKYIDMGYIIKDNNGNVLNNPLNYATTKEQTILVPMSRK